jgi:hypothetical protein
MWSHECPTALEEHRVDFVPFDFFKEGPVKGQDIYYVSMSSSSSTVVSLSLSMIRCEISYTIGKMLLLWISSTVSKVRWNLGAVCWSVCKVKFSVEYPAWRSSLSFFFFVLSFFLGGEGVCLADEYVLPGSHRLYSSDATDAIVCFHSFLMVRGGWWFLLCLNYRLPNRCFRTLGQATFAVCLHSSELILPWLFMRLDASILSRHQYDDSYKREGTIIRWVQGTGVSILNSISCVPDDNLIPQCQGGAGVCEGMGFRGEGDHRVQIPPVTLPEVIHILGWIFIDQQNWWWRSQ